MFCKFVVIISGDLWLACNKGNSVVYNTANI